MRRLENPIVFLILLNIVLLLLGALLDIFSVVVIMVPLILPVAVGFGIHPLHLGRDHDGESTNRLFHATDWS